VNRCSGSYKGLRSWLSKRSPGILFVLALFLSMHIRCTLLQAPPFSPTTRRLNNITPPLDVKAVFFSGLFAPRFVLTSSSAESTPLLTNSTSALTPSQLHLCRNHPAPMTLQQGPSLRSLHINSVPFENNARSSLQEEVVSFGCWIPHVTCAAVFPLTLFPVEKKNSIFLYRPINTRYNFNLLGSVLCQPVPRILPP